MLQQQEPQQSTSGQTTHHKAPDATIEDEQLSLLTNKRKNKSQLHKINTPVEPNVIVIDNENIELLPLCAEKSEEENQREQQPLMETRKQIAETELCEQQLNDTDQPANIQGTSESSDTSKLDQVTNNAISSQADKEVNWCSQNRKKVKKCIKSFFELFNFILTLYLGVYWIIESNSATTNSTKDLIATIFIINFGWLAWQIREFCSKNSFGKGGMSYISFIAGLALQTLMFFFVKAKSNLPA